MALWFLFAAPIYAVPLSENTGLKRGSEPSVIGQANDAAQRTSTAEKKSPDLLLSEVLAAGINAGHAMEMLEHHAELLATVYAIAGTLLGVIIGVAAWIGYGRISDIKDELSESLDTKLDATRRVSDRDHCGGSCTANKQS